MCIGEEKESYNVDSGRRFGRRLVYSIVVEVVGV